MLRLLKWVVLVTAVLAALAAWWLHRPLTLSTDADGVVDLAVPAGASARGVARAAVAAGVQTDDRLLFAWFRLSGQSRQIKAGAYELRPGVTPRGLLDQLVRGEQAFRQVTLIEGWTFRQVLAALQSAEHLVDDVKDLPWPELMARIGQPGVHPEGRFFPDTYRYAKRASASSVLQQASLAMQRRLESAWAMRDPGVPLRSPDEALILASIVEKETGLASDRAQIAGVFANRLRIGMRLQTDPTVIYGLGERFDGRLRRRDLDTDTPYNTYTRAGLPPTPIAMPGQASLVAAVKPAATRAMYFVARGDGSSEFSATLDEHNRAVRRFILGR